MLSFGIVVVCARSKRIVDLTPYIAGLLDAASRAALGRVENAGP